MAASAQLAEIIAAGESLSKQLSWSNAPERFQRWNDRAEREVDMIAAGRYAFLYFLNEGFPPEEDDSRGYSLAEQLRNRIARLRDIQERVAVATGEVTDPAIIRCVAARELLLDVTHETHELIAEHPFPWRLAPGCVARTEKVIRSALRARHARHFLGTKGLETDYQEGRTYRRVHHLHLRSLQLQTRLASDPSLVRPRLDPQKAIS